MQRPTRCPARRNQRATASSASSLARSRAYYSGSAMPAARVSAQLRARGNVATRSADQSQVVDKGSFFRTYRDRKRLRPVGVLQAPRGALNHCDQVERPRVVGAHVEYLARSCLRDFIFAVRRFGGSVAQDRIDAIDQRVTLRAPFLVNAVAINRESRVVLIGAAAGTRSAQVGVPLEGLLRDKMKIAALGAL